MIPAAAWAYLKQSYTLQKLWNRVVARTDAYKHLSACRDVPVVVYMTLFVNVILAVLFGSLASLAHETAQT